MTSQEEEDRMSEEVNNVDNATTTCSEPSVKGNIEDKRKSTKRKISSLEVNYDAPDLGEMEMNITGVKRCPSHNDFSSPASLLNQIISPTSNDISNDEKHSSKNHTSEEETAEMCTQVTISASPSTPCSFRTEDAPPPLPLSNPPSSTSRPTHPPIGSDEMTLDFTFHGHDVFDKEDKMISGLDQFFTENQSTESEIAKILADFNEILNSDDPYAFSTPESEEYITSTVEAFSDLLIDGENELLIVVEEDEDELLSIDDGPKSNGSSQGMHEGEEAFEEGYESDLPMVRKSMRKLRPLHMGPIPTNPNSGSGSGNGGSVPSGSSLHLQSPHSSTYPQYLPTTVIPTPPLITALRVTTSQSNNINNVNTGSENQGNGLQSVVDTTPTPTLNLHMESQSETTGSGGVTREVSTTTPDTSTRSPFHLPGTTDGCATFRPTTDLVFANLHVLPPDLSEALAADESGEGTATTAAAGATNGSVSTVRPPTTTSTNTPSSTHIPPGPWPHRLSSVLALMGCTLGLTNICRFSSLSVEYGANFTLQFAFLSLVFGIPLFLFHMSIGQYLAAGIVDMWKISPIFQGIGIGLVMSVAMIGVYTAVGVSWMFIYFRDSFIPRYDQYRWGKCFRDFRFCEQNLFNNSQLAETVPDYFNGVVLQRSSPDFPSSAYIPSGLKFTVAFNLAVVWMLVFVSLSKGLKSYGKVIHGFILIPITAMLILASKMVGLVPSEDAGLLFGQTSWEDFFFNTQTWVIAAREVFFTWGLLGACVMQITAHNRPSHSLKSDATIIVLITTFVLLLASFLGNACHFIVQAHGYDYVPSSFESEQSFRFLIRKPHEATTPPQFPSHLTNQHTSFLMGIRITKADIGEGLGENNSGNTVSGYQALRLATELFPASMVLLGSQGLSPFWTVLFYFTFILFGLAQQLAIWYTVIKGMIAIKPKILKSWETTISFSICAVGFVLGLPLCTDFGIFVEYFLDYTIGSGWWIMVLYLLELVAVFIVRGAPYCGENIVTVLFRGGSKVNVILAPILSFLWNVILPVAVLILSISSFKSGNVRELYDWTSTQGYVFWPSWTRELGSLIQLLPLLTVPFVAIIQSCRYLANGPPDLFDRIQLLYRPHSRGLGNSSHFSDPGGATTDFPSHNASEIRINEDPPPKYTPPPSYSAVTGAKIAKFLRNSIRRSIRRISGPSTSNSSTETLPPPPNYTSVILEIGNGSRDYDAQAGSSGNCSLGTENLKGTNFLPILISLPPEEIGAAAGGSGYDSGRRRFEINITTNNNQSRASTLGRTGPFPNDPEVQGQPGTNEKSSLRRIASDITPREVARILRASFRVADDVTVMRDNMGVMPVSSGSNNNTYQSHHDESLDSLSIINQETVSSSSSSEGIDSIPINRGFDFCSRSRRNRRSNDSQLSLLTNQHLQSGHTSSQENVNYVGQMNEGIVNRTFQMTAPVPPPTATATTNIVHVRTNSLTVPVTIDPSLITLQSQSSTRQVSHRTN